MAKSLNLHKKPFRYFIRKYASFFGWGMAFVFLTNFFDVITPALLKQAIDQIRDKAEVESLATTCFLFFVCLALVALFRYFWRIYFGRFHHSVADDLRNQIFEKLTELSPSFFQKKTVGQIMSLVTNDVNSFRMAIGPGILILMDGIILSALILPIMFYMNWQWTLQVLILLPFVPFVIQRVEKLVFERFKIQQDRYADMSGRAQEIISGVRVIKGFAQEKNQLGFFNQKSKTYENACNDVAFVDSAFHPIMEFTVAFGSVILLYVASPDVMRAEVTIGTMVAFQQFIQRMAWPMTAIGAGITFIQQGRASFKRIDDLLLEEPEVVDSGETVIKDFESLEFHNLSFTYPGAKQEALKDVSFKINRGETLGLVGPVGAGKSTLIQVLTRLWQTPSNMVSVNGIPLNDISLKSLRDLIAYVPQDAFLFSNTVADNIRFSLKDHITDESIKEMARSVRIHKEIEKVPGGYHAMLGERGVNLSGGQKQRLTIARALIKESPIIILDDSLSAVDSRTEKNIVEKIKEVSEGPEGYEPTIIIVSHRLATLKHADRIVVIDDGKIDAIGSHDDLVEKSETYKRLDQLQSGELPGGQGNSETSL